MQMHENASYEHRNAKVYVQVDPHTDRHTFLYFPFQLALERQCEA